MTKLEVFGILLVSGFTLSVSGFYLSTLIKYSPTEVSRIPEFGSIDKIAYFMMHMSCVYLVPAISASLSLSAYMLFCERHGVFPSPLIIIIILAPYVGMAFLLSKLQGRQTPTFSFMPSEISNYAFAASYPTVLVSYVIRVSHLFPTDESLLLLSTIYLTVPLIILGAIKTSKVIFGISLRDNILTSAYYACNTFFSIAIALTMTASTYGDAS